LSGLLLKNVNQNIKKYNMKYLYVILVLALFSSCEKNQEDLEIVINSEVQANVENTKGVTAKTWCNPSSTPYHPIYASLKYGHLRNKFWNDDGFAGVEYSYKNLPEGTIIKITGSNDQGGIAGQYSISGTGKLNLSLRNKYNSLCRRNSDPNTIYVNDYTVTQIRLFGEWKNVNAGSIFNFKSNCGVENGQGYYYTGLRIWVEGDSVRLGVRRDCSPSDGPDE